MLAALLLNLDRAGPILRDRDSASVGRDVLKATKQIEDILFPLPAKTKVKIKRAMEKVYEYSELPSVDTSTLGESLKLTQLAIDDVKSLIQDLEQHQWAIELHVMLEQLLLISWRLNDDEEALLLLM